MIINFQKLFIFCLFAIVTNVFGTCYDIDKQIRNGFYNECNLVILTTSNMQQMNVQINCKDQIFEHKTDARQFLEYTKFIPFNQSCIIDCRVCILKCIFNYINSKCRCNEHRDNICKFINTHMVYKCGNNPNFSMCINIDQDRINLIQNALGDVYQEYNGNFIVSYYSRIAFRQRYVYIILRPSNIKIHNLDKKNAALIKIYDDYIAKNNGINRKKIKYAEYEYDTGLIPSNPSEIFNITGNRYINVINGHTSINAINE